MVTLKNTIFIIAASLTQSLVAVAQQESIDNNNTFALAFYSQWRGQTDKNIVLSPFSISAAIGMTYPGARNATAEQMKMAMRFHSNQKQQSKDFYMLMTQINAPGSPMVISNALWMQKGFRVEPEFLNVNAQYFGSSFHPVDFARSPDSTRTTINASIEKQTRDKIKNLLPAGSINALTRMVLTNAIYFKDSWATRFDPSKTKDQYFFVLPAKPVMTKFMTLHDVTFNYFENEGASIVELPYQNARFSMLIILPKGDVSALEKVLTGAAYKSWNFKQGIFRTVQIPRFKIDHQVQPVAILKHFGMTDAFKKGKADFSGISKEAPLFISSVFHKAFIEVNEEGTEAAAATAAVIQMESAIEPDKKMDFIANKPFLFILRDRISNAILFIGKVKNPTQ